MAVDRPANITPQLLFGLGVIAVGVLFTLDNLHVIHAEDYLQYWPLFLIAIGLLKLYQTRDGRSGTLGGLIFTVAGVWLLLEETAVIRVSFWDMWPLLLVLFGIHLVWQGATGRRPGRPDADSNATVSALAILGGVVRGNNSRQFRGGSLTAVMGGCDIDLRQAAIDGEAVLDVSVMWGGIEIKVPEDWTVVSHVVPLMAGFEDKTRPPQGATTHRLIIRGFAIMAGIEVKN
jgi:predicted membrane protein